MVFRKGEWSRGPLHGSLASCAAMIVVLFCSQLRDHPAQEFSAMLNSMRVLTRFQPLYFVSCA